MRAVTCCASMGRDMGLRAARRMAWRFLEPNAVPRSEWLRFMPGRVEYDPGAPLALGRAKGVAAGEPEPGAARHLSSGSGHSYSWWGLAACRAGYFHRSRCGDRLWSVFVEATGASRWFVGRGWRSSKGTRGGAIVRRILRARWLGAHQERGFVIVSGPAPSRRKELARASGRRAFCSPSGLEAVDNASA